MLPCITSVIDHKRCQNVVRSWMAQSAIIWCATFLFLPNFDASFTRDLRTIYTDAVPFVTASISMRLHLSFTRCRSSLLSEPGSCWKRFQKWNVFKTICSSICNCIDFDAITHFVYTVPVEFVISTGVILKTLSTVECFQNDTVSLVM